MVRSLAHSLHWRGPIVPARGACDNRRATVLQGRRQCRGRRSNTAVRARKSAPCSTTSSGRGRSMTSTISGSIWHDPALLARTWASVKEVMAPGALDPLTKEMVYLAVSVTNGCAYCIASHTAAARKAGMSDAMFGELMGVVGMANETNRLANGYRVPVDPAFELANGEWRVVSSE